MEISKKDRISELPNDIRQHILSFLPYKQAIATSLLSKTWRFDWFNIDNSYFPELWRSYDRYSCKSPIRPMSQNPNLRYLHFLDKTLTRIRNFLGDDQLSIPNLKLRFQLTTPYLNAEEFSPEIGEYLTKLKVKNLSLSINLNPDLISNEFVIRYVSTLPIVLSELEFYNCYPPPRPPTTVSCLPIILSCRLRKLSLTSIPIEQSKIDELIAGCNCVESLTFEHCDGLTYLNLVGVSKLTELGLKYNCNLGSVVMDGATNFRYFEYGHTHSELRLLVLSNVGSLEERDLSSKLSMECVNFQLSRCSIKKLKIISCDILAQDELCMSDLEILEIVSFKKRLDLLRLDSCRRLTHLHLINSHSMTDEWLNSNLSRLDNLKVLEIKYCDELRHVKIVQEHLKTLILYDCEGLKSVVMDCPNLSHFKYQGHIFLELVERSTISPCSFVELACYRFSKIVHANVLAMLNIFGNSKHLTLRNLRIEDLMKLMEMRQSHSYFFPLYQVKHLKVVTYFGSPTPEQYAQNTYVGSPPPPLGVIMDALLWLFPQLDSIRFSSPPEILSSFDFIVRFVYTEPMERSTNNCGCYASDLPINCWQHALKIIEKNEGFDDDDSMEMFFNVGFSVSQ